MNQQVRMDNQSTLFRLEVRRCLQRAMDLGETPCDEMCMDILERWVDDDTKVLDVDTLETILQEEVHRAIAFE